MPRISPLTLSCVFQEVPGARDGDRVVDDPEKIITGFLGVSTTARPHRNAMTALIATAII